MHAKTAQERTGMLSGSMTKGCIRVGSAPGEDGDAINDQIAGANEPTTQSSQHAEHKESLREWRSRLLPAFPLLRGTRNARTTIFAQRQAAGQGESRPVAQPVTHILIGESPQGAQERDEQQRRFAVGPRAPSWPSGQGGWTAMMG